MGVERYDHSANEAPQTGSSSSREILQNKVKKVVKVVSSGVLAFEIAAGGVAHAQGVPDITDPATPVGGIAAPDTEDTGSEASVDSESAKIESSESAEKSIVSELAVQLSQEDQERFESLAGGSAVGTTFVLPGDGESLERDEILVLGGGNAVAFSRSEDRGLASLIQPEEGGFNMAPSSENTEINAMIVDNTLRADLLDRGVNISEGEAVLVETLKNAEGQDQIIKLQTPEKDFNFTQTIATGSPNTNIRIIPSLSGIGVSKLGESTPILLPNTPENLQLLDLENFEYNSDSEFIEVRMDRGLYWYPVLISVGGGLTQTSYVRTDVANPQVVPNGPVISSEQQTRIEIKGGLTEEEAASFGTPPENSTIILRGGEIVAVDLEGREFISDGYEWVDVTNADEAEFARIELNRDIYATEGENGHKSNEWRLSSSFPGTNTIILNSAWGINFTNYEDKETISGFGEMLDRFRYQTWLNGISADPNQPWPEGFAELAPEGFSPGDAPYGWTTTDFYNYSRFSKPERKENVTFEQWLELAKSGEVNVWVADHTYGSENCSADVVDKSGCAGWNKVDITKLDIELELLKFDPYYNSRYPDISYDRHPNIGITSAHGRTVIFSSEGDVDEGVNPTIKIVSTQRVNYSLQPKEFMGYVQRFGLMSIVQRTSPSLVHPRFTVRNEGSRETNIQSYDKYGLKDVAAAEKRAMGDDFFKKEQPIRP